MDRYCEGRLVNQSSPSSPTGESDNYGRRFNSAMWILIELVITMSQTIAAIICLSLTRDEYLEDPLLTWVIGYSASCIAILPYLFWRYIQCSKSGSEQGSANLGRIPRFNNHESTSCIESLLIQVVDIVFDAFFLCEQYIATSRPRVNLIVDLCIVALEIFNITWICVGTLWLFDEDAYDSDAPNLYWLSIVFLAFSSAKYATLFILSLAIYVSLIFTAFIISSSEVTGEIREIASTRFSASSSLIALPTYKFRSMTRPNIEAIEIDLERQGGGGILTTGTGKEQTISAEDSFCCICLAEYANSDEIRELPCMHLFHLRCVDRWLRLNMLCPLCKSEVRSSIGITLGVHKICGA